MKLSIVIPVLNESLSIPLMIDHWRILHDVTEVLFVDGGSNDGTPELLRKAGFAVIAAAKGRARQMNAGVA
jgi:glycosyltransferase involved in cell wall biosynthesis